GTTCITDTNGVTTCNLDANVQLPFGSVDVPITLTATICNDGTADLSVDIAAVFTNPSTNVLVSCADDTTPASLGPILLAGGACSNVQVCFLASCPPGANVQILVSGTAVTNKTVQCICDSFGNPIKTGTNAASAC